MQQIVRSNKSSPKDRRKCSTDFHNQPKMAIAQKQQQEKDEQQGVKKAKDFLFTSLRYHRRKFSNPKMSHDVNDVEGQTGEAKEVTEHPSMQKLVMYDTGTVVASSLKSYSSNRKSTPDYKNEATSNATQQATEANVEGVATAFCYGELQGQSSALQQCHCIMCFKSDGVAFTNNVTMTNTTDCATLNKYIFAVASQGQRGENMVQQKQKHQQNEEQFPSYQCPTGKLCCLDVNVLQPATCTNESRAAKLVTSNSSETKTTHPHPHPHPHSVPEPMTNNNLSTRRTAKTATPQQTNGKLKGTVWVAEQQHKLHKHQVNSYKCQRTLNSEWDILAHLTEDHKLPVYQYYAEYGQRIPLQCLGRQNFITCLNLRGSDENAANVEKFFLACMPLEMPTTAADHIKVAIFLYHLNTRTTLIDISTSAANSISHEIDEVSNFETIMENSLTGIKWFGRAHPLTTPWSHILEKQHFFRHNVPQYHSVAVSMSAEEAVRGGGGGGGGGTGAVDALVIVIKRKNKILNKN